MDVFAALADPRRRDILEMLAKSGKLTASDISGKFKVSPPAISQHLKVLREARLVNVEKKGQMRIYSINAKSLEYIENWLLRTKKHWQEKFGRLEKLLERMKEVN